MVPFMVVVEDSDGATKLRDVELSVLVATSVPLIATVALANELPVIVTVGVWLMPYAVGVIFEIDGGVIPVRVTVLLDPMSDSDTVTVLAPVSSGGA